MSRDFSLTREKGLSRVARYATRSYTRARYITESFQTGESYRTRGSSDATTRAAQVGVRCRARDGSRSFLPPSAFTRWMAVVRAPIGVACGFEPALSARSGSRSSARKSRRGERFDFGVKHAP